MRRRALSYVALIAALAVVGALVLH